MSLLQTVNRAQTAASHAKPFLKLIEVLAQLDSELRGANQIQADADQAAQTKAQLEQEISRLKSEQASLSHSVGAVNDEIRGKTADFEKSLEEKDAALKARHAQAEKDHKAELADQRKLINKAKDDLAELARQKQEMQAQIDALKDSFQKAHAALV